MSKNKEYIHTPLFFFTVVLSSHFLFSKFGFNPTDEGFILHISNCLWHGQIPHIDFVSIRPVGSAILHIFELYFKDNLFLYSRFFFWAEQLLIAMLWYNFLCHQLNTKNNYLIDYCIILLIYLFNVHYFPAMPLHTIDAVFCLLIGLNIISRNYKLYSLGFLFVGYAVLCKQNFLAALPIIIFLYGNKHVFRNTVISSTPIMIYIVAIYLNGGLEELITQIQSQTNIINVGILSYLKNYSIYISLVCYLLLYYTNIKKIYILIVLLILHVCLLITQHYTGKFSFAILGVLLAEIITDNTSSNKIKTIVICLIISWCVSISVGYHTPALFVGSCIGLILLLHQNTILKYKIAFFSIVPIATIAFLYVRYYTIYREQAATHLKYKLDNIVEGANGIYTNKNTYDVLKELKEIKKAYQHIEVVPDFTACHIFDAHQSIIKINWANQTETANPEVVKTLYKKIAASKLNSVITIPKFQTAQLQNKLVQLNADDYPLAKIIKHEYQKIDEKKYFYLYQSK